MNTKGKFARRRKQCKDIPDAVFMAAVQATPPMSARYRRLGDDEIPRQAWRSRADVRRTLEVLVGPVPEKLFLAKARKLGARGILGGCTSCTCRGDYHDARQCTSCCQLKGE